MFSFIVVSIIHVYKMTHSYISEYGYRPAHLKYNSLISLEASADLEGRQGVRTLPLNTLPHPEKLQSYRVSYQYWSGSATKHAFNVGQSSARQRNAI